MKTHILGLIFGLIASGFAQNTYGSTNGTNQIAVRTNGIYWEKWPFEDRVFEGEVYRIWYSRADKLSADALNHFNFNMRYFQYSDQDELEGGVEDMGLRIASKSAKDAARETLARAPVLHDLKNRGNAFASSFWGVIVDSIGNTEEEEIRSTQISGTTNEMVALEILSDDISDISSTNKVSSTNKISLFRKLLLIREFFINDHIKYGARPWRVSPYAYAIFEIGPHEDPLMYGNLRLHYKKFSEAQFEGLISVPLGKGIVVSSGFLQEIQSPYESKRWTVKVHKQFGKDHRTFVGASLLHHTRFFIGYEREFP